MFKKLRNQQQGFTIIEVLIVLAIAGLIMVIVFLAVPALQRNARNTQRRAEASNYIGAVNEYISNNNGSLPPSSPAAAATAAATTIAGLAKLKLMTAPTTIRAGARTTATALDTMEVVVQAKCDTAVVGDTVAGTARSVAVRFAVENSTGGAVKQCLDA